jgi:hypothetical protein
MRTLIDQPEASLGSRLYFLSLFTALALPDIAGALESDDGRAIDSRYIAWYECWVRPRLNDQALEALAEFKQRRIEAMRANGMKAQADREALEPESAFQPIENPLSGDLCWEFRCSMLHQGRSRQHPKNPAPRIIFIEPGATSNTFNSVAMDGALLIDLPSFCRQVISGARLWLQSAEATENYRRNYEHFAKRHPQGIAPFVAGVPVIG